MSIAFSSDDDPRKVKIKVSCRLTGSVTNGAVRLGLLAALDALETITHQHSVVDRGHTFSSGKFFACFWVTMLGNDCPSQVVSDAVVTDPDASQTLSVDASLAVAVVCDSQPPLTTDKDAPGDLTSLRVHDVVAVDVGMVTQDIEISHRWCSVASTLSSTSRSQAHLLGRLCGLHRQMEQLRATLRTNNTLMSTSFASQDPAD